MFLNFGDRILVQLGRSVYSLLEISAYSYRLLVRFHNTDNMGLPTQLFNRLQDPFIYQAIKFLIDFCSHGIGNSSCITEARCGFRVHMNGSLKVLQLTKFSVEDVFGTLQV